MISLYKSYKSTDSFSYSFNNFNNCLLSLCFILNAITSINIISNIPINNNEIQLWWESSKGPGDSLWYEIYRNNEFIEGDYAKINVEDESYKVTSENSEKVKVILNEVN